MRDHPTSVDQQAFSPGKGEVDSLPRCSQQKETPFKAHDVPLSTQEGASNSSADLPQPVPSPLVEGSTWQSQSLAKQEIAQCIDRIARRPTRHDITEQVQ
jgi:hypothetical protein